MITLDVDQGTDEWYAARRGIPTASNFSKLLTNTLKDGHYKRSTSIKDYITELVAERLGMYEEGYKSFAMEEGIRKEEHARAMYAFETGQTVSEVGLCYKDEDRLFSASPDSLVGDDGLLEIKCPIGKTHAAYLLRDEVPTVYRQQVLGQLYVTGREWCDFMSYNPMAEYPHDTHIIRVYPDKDFFDDLEAVLEFVNNEVNDKLNKLGL